jgi:hypothetical protein
MHIAQLSSVCRDTGTEPPRPQVKQSRATADPLKNPQLLIAAACPKQKASRSQSGGLVGWPYRDRTSAIAGYAIAGHCRSPEETSAARSCSLSQTKNPRILIRGFVGGRYWDRTSDLFRVREARYRCANRPLNIFRCVGFVSVGGGDGIRTRVDGFAGRCLASRPRHRVWLPTCRDQPGRLILTLERMTRFELATLTLAR